MKTNEKSFSLKKWNATELYRNSVQSKWKTSQLNSTNGMWRRYAAILWERNGSACRALSMNPTPFYSTDSTQLFCLRSNRHGTYWAIQLASNYFIYIYKYIRCSFTECKSWCNLKNYAWIVHFFTNGWRNIRVKICKVFLPLFSALSYTDTHLIFAVSSNKT
jgi:hypothetical protein